MRQRGPMASGAFLFAFIKTLFQASGLALSLHKGTKYFWLSGMAKRGFRDSKVNRGLKCVFGEEQGQWKLIGIYQSYPPSAHLNAGTLEFWFEARLRAVLERNSPMYFIPGLCCPISLHPGFYSVRSINGNSFL